MNTGAIIGIGIGVALVAVVFGSGMGSTLIEFSESGKGLPNNDDENKMQMSENIEVKVTKSPESPPMQGPSQEKQIEKSSEGKTVQINLKDGAGTGDR